MSPFDRVLLYIGAPKTGTTTIQNILRRNRSALMRQGFHVPRAGQAGTGQHIEAPAIVSSGHSRADLDRHFDFHRHSKDERRRRFIRELDEEIVTAPKCHTLLLFSEHMFYSDAGEIPAYRDLMSRYASRLECLMYLRRQDRWLGSLSIQIRKTDPNWRLALDLGPASDYGRRVRAWDQGTDACHVRRFEAEFLRGGDLLADFSHTVGLDPEGLEIGEPRANPSLRQEQLELMDALNGRLATLPPARRVHMRQGFVPLCTEVAGGRPIEFARQAAEAAFAAHAEINGWLRENKDPGGPPQFFESGFEDYPDAPQNDTVYSEQALHDILREIDSLSSSQGRGATTPSEPKDRQTLIDHILTAYMALRRATP